RPDAEPVDDILQIGEDLGLGAVRLRPFLARGEGEGIEVRGHVAGAARIAIVPPGAADARRLLQDGEIAVAGLAEPDGGADAAGAGADDSDAHRFPPENPIIVADRTVSGRASQSRFPAAAQRTEQIGRGNTSMDALDYFMIQNLIHRYADLLDRGRIDE